MDVNLFDIIQYLRMNVNDFFSYVVQLNMAKLYRISCSVGP